MQIANHMLIGFHTLIVMLEPSNADEAQTYRVQSLNVAPTEGETIEELYQASLSELCNDREHKTHARALNDFAQLATSELIQEVHQMTADECFVEGQERERAKVA